MIGGTRPRGRRMPETGGERISCRLQRCAGEGAGGLRITGGSLCGRHLRVPDAAVRPTQDRVREALFALLQEAVPGRRFLDLFAGSGAVGLEAWSRGASAVCWVEAERRVCAVLKANVTALCGAASVTACRCQDVFAFCRQPATEGGFDVVFADPPYATRGDAGMVARVPAAVRAGRLLRAGGLLVLEQGAGEPVPAAAGWGLVRERRYGGAVLRLLREETES